MKQENDLDFDVFSQAIFMEPGSGQHEDCADLVAIIGQIEFQADDLDFDVMNQACFQEAPADIDADCAALAARIWAHGMRQCAFPIPYQRFTLGRGACWPDRATRRRLHSLKAGMEWSRQRQSSGAQAPPA